MNRIYWRSMEMLLLWLKYRVFVLKTLNKIRSEFVILKTKTTLKDKYFKIYFHTNARQCVTYLINDPNRM